MYTYKKTATEGLKLPVQSQNILAWIPLKVKAETKAYTQVVYFGM